MKKMIVVDLDNSLLNSKTECEENSQKLFARIKK